jgi:uncharacterized repeat protein (TIGR01451 family)
LLHRTISRRGSRHTVLLELKNTGASPATNTNNVEIFLPAGLTYQGMQAGPAPVTVTGDSSTGTTLVWNNSLGDVGANQSVFTVKVGATPDTSGEIQFCSYKATYGDVYGERFRAEQCRTIIVYNSPKPVISKDPSSQSVMSGTVVSWTLNYSNTGAEPLYNTVIEDILPRESVSSPPYPRSHLHRWCCRTEAPGFTGIPGHWQSAKAGQLF